MTNMWTNWRRATTLLIALAGVVIATSPTLAQTEAKLGFINSERLYLEYEGFKQAEADYKNELDGWLRDLRTREENLVQLESDYRAQQPMLSEERRLQRENELQRSTREYEQFRESIFGQSGLAQQRNQELLEPVLAQVQSAVESVAADEEFAIIFDAVDGNIIFGEKRYDITDLVLDQLRGTLSDTTVPDSDGS
jgi:outer membrane protein